MEEQEAPLRYSRSRWIFIKKEDRPYVEYLFHVSEAGSYDIAFHMAATTPVVYERKHYIGYSVIEGELCIQNTVDDENNQFFLSAQWTREAYNNIKITRGNIVCKKGKNCLRFFGMSPSIILERIVILRENIAIPESYLGPSENFWIKAEDI